jgi:hypothetical protein
MLPLILAYVNNIPRQFDADFAGRIQVLVDAFIAVLLRNQGATGVPIFFFDINLQSRFSTYYCSTTDFLLKRRWSPVSPHQEVVPKD